MLTPPPFTIPDGLVVASAQALSTKLADFAGAGAGTMHAIMDFDRTLTIRQPGTDHEITTWHILCRQLPPAGQRTYEQLYAKYRPMELNGTLTEQDILEWSIAVLSLFVRHAVNLTAVEEDFLQKASIRPHTLELFKSLAENNIPTVILSAGIREIITMWCDHYGITPTLVVSGAILVDDNRRVVGWDEENLRNIVNKTASTYPELLRIRTERPKVFLVGDSLEDAKMAVGERDVIRLRVLDTMASRAASRLENRETFARFDGLIRTGSFQPMCDLVDLVIR